MADETTFQDNSPIINLRVRYYSDKFQNNFSRISRISNEFFNGPLRFSYGFPTNLSQKKIHYGFSTDFLSRLRIDSTEFLRILSPEYCQNQPLPYIFNLELYFYQILKLIFA